MREKLESGVTLVVDRYSYSGVAFTASKGYDVQWCYQPEVGMISPDLVIWLDMPLEDVKSRGGFGEERYEKLEMQERVQKLFSKFAEIDEDTWTRVDARGSVESIHEKIMKLGLNIVKNVTDASISLMKALPKDFA